MIIRRIDAVSCGRVMGTMYLLIGFVFGALYSLSSLGMLVAAREGAEDIDSQSFGLGAIILFPVVYGLMGFIGGILMAFLYNVVVVYVGGIKVEFQPPDEHLEIEGNPMN